MIIGLDASRSVSTIQKTGVEKVSDELLRQFVNFQFPISNFQKQEVNFIYYTPHTIDWLPGENQRILRWPFKLLWTQIRLALELIFHPPQVMFFPVHAMPLLFITSYKLRVTSYYKVIHDIAFKKQPQLYSFKQKFILNLDLWLAKKICTKIFVPTEAVRQDLIKYTKINSDKIIVTPWGHKILNNEFGIMNYGERKKQILYLGRVEEKKNIGNLIKGFQLFSKEHPDYQLVLAGKIDYKFQNNIYTVIPAQAGIQTKKQKEKNWIPGSRRPARTRRDSSPEDDSDNIKFLGYIDEEKKQELLRESVAMVLVSKEEGFGFPILEAFDFGLPVVASDIPVLREIGGDACLYINPDSPEDIADKLNFILSGAKDPVSNAPLAESLVKKGHDRLKQFNWPDTAEKILAELSK